MNVLFSAPQDRGAVFSSRVVECGCDSPTCEGSLYAFETSAVIAEFVSTVTMVPLLITGVWFYIHARGLHTRFMALALFSIGIAGLWYHSSLTWWGQVFDRMMCIWFFASALKCTRHVASETLLPAISRRKLMAMDFISITLVVTSLPASIVGWHGVVYMAGFLSTLYLILPLHAEFKHMPIYKSFLMSSLKLTSVALFCFLMDDLLLASNSCHVFPFFHAIWHVLVAIGMHKILAYNQFVEMHWRGERGHEIKYRLFTLPYVARERVRKQRDEEGQISLMASIDRSKTWKPSAHRAE